jgi:hypothetical protein
MRDRPAAFRRGLAGYLLLGNNIESMANQSRASGKGKALLLAVAALLLVSLTGAASAAELTIQPDAADGRDSMLRQDNPNMNYGTSTILYVGRTASGDALRSLFLFNASSIPPNSTITGARFEAWMFLASSSTNLTTGLYALNHTWEEGSGNGAPNSGSVNGTTWWSRWYGLNWSSYGGDYASSPEDAINVTNVAGWFSWDVTDITKGWYNGSVQDVGFILVSSGGADEYRGFYSSDYATNASRRPRLVVTYTANLPPSIINVSDNSNQTHPTNVGENVNFTVYWSDVDSDQARLYVCGSSGVTYAGGCSGTQFCSTSYSPGSPLQCSYAVQASDNTSVSYWAGVCDNEGNCTVSGGYDFWVNRLPTAALQYPNGGEYINQSQQGNYAIVFQVSDPDNDNLTADIYYSDSPGGRTHPIVLGLPLNSTNCYDPDGRTNTTNNCTYSWDSTDIVGVYWMDVDVNDSFASATDSSDGSFQVQSLIDTDPPLVWNASITGNLTSGEPGQVRANATDPHIRYVWAELNLTGGGGMTVTMAPEAGDIYMGSFEAGQAGNWGYRVHADDLNGNPNVTGWQYFDVGKPQAAVQGENYPNIALPSSVISIRAKLNATDLIRGVNASLNIGPAFSFSAGYDQVQDMGNFSAGEVKQSYWILSSPAAEGIYTFNITYSDAYGNVWSSPDFDIQITSALGGIFVDINSQVEIMAGTPYTAQVLVRNGNGNFIDPDTLSLSLTDPLGNPIVTAVNYTSRIAAGIYNYTYNTAAGQIQGHWLLTANATYYGNDYIDLQFWKLTGGPFDVRDIAVTDSSVPSLAVSVTLENTGGANQDITLVWNLTREDTGGMLDSGADTVMVPANSAVVHTVSASTDYIGTVRITFLGYYSGTETAGAFDVFDTTEEAPPVTPPSGPSGGGGGAALPPALPGRLEFISVLREVYAYPGQSRTVDLVVRNAGGQALQDVSLSLEGVPPGWYAASPPFSLEPNATGTFSVSFAIPADALVSSYPFTYAVRSGSVQAGETATLHVVSEAEALSQQLQQIRERMSNIRYTMEGARDKGLDVSAPETLLGLAGDLLPGIEAAISSRDFGSARKDLGLAGNYLDQAEQKLGELGVQVLQKPASFLELYGLWIVTWSLIIILIVLTVLVLRKGFTKTYRLSLREGQSREKDMDRFNQRLRRIRRKLRGGGYER